MDMHWVDVKESKMVEKRDELAAEGMVALMADYLDMMRAVMMVEWMAVLMVGQTVED